MTSDLEGVEGRLRERLEQLPPAARAELLRVLTLPSFDSADAIGAYYNPATRTFAELLIDCEEDRTLRACWSACCGRLSMGARRIGSLRRTASVTRTFPRTQ